MKRALLLINPGSRNAGTERALIAPALERHGISVLETSERDPGLFCQLIERFREQVDCVVVAGGDGSCLCVVEKLRETGLPLGIIPLGTANNLARSLAIPFDIDEAARIIGEGAQKKIDVGLVNGTPFLNVSGMGLSTQVNRRVPRELKRRWGVLAYAMYLFKVGRRMKRFSATITCDGKTLRTKSLQITVCNGRHYGAGMTILEDAAIDDHRLDLITADPGTWWRGFRLLPDMMRGRYRPRSGIAALSGRAFEIRTTPPLSIDTDGEVTTRTPARFEIVPNAVTVFAPRTAEARAPERRPSPSGPESRPQHPAA